jgi:glycosyltransferase involved in cell wall biosynthesis
MRIGLNLLYLIPGRSGGTETYGRSLIRALSAADQENDYFVFFNREASKVPFPAASNFHRVGCAVTAIHRSLRYGWEQALLPLQLRKLQIDLVHSLGYVMPLLSPCASLVTIPDMNLRAIPEYLPLRKRAVLAIPRFFCVQSARRAARVITISDFSKAEITLGIGVKPDKVVVTHLAPRLDTRERPGVPWEIVRERYGLPEPYIVAIGGTSRHKNIVRLIAAFRTLKDSYPHALVIPGHIPTDVDVPAEMARPGMAGRLRCPGYVPEDHLASILARADLFVLPSLYEGFGLPVVEAQQACVAVACSTAGSLPEVAGQGAVYFDPRSVESMTATIKRCLDDANLRKELCARGRENVKRFSWSNTAKLTLEAYRQVALERRLRR